MLATVQEVFRLRIKGPAKAASSVCRYSMLPSPPHLLLCSTSASASACPPQIVEQNPRSLLPVSIASTCLWSEIQRHRKRRPMLSLQSPLKTLSPSPADHVRSRLSPQLLPRCRRLRSPTQYSEAPPLHTSTTTP
jgi:hypothetical protein